VFWTAGIHILTQNTTNEHVIDIFSDLDKIDTMNNEKNTTLFPMYSSVENIWDFGPRAYQAHKAFLI
jgi:hypothetical protein